MRITNNIALRNAVAGLADNRAAVAKLQTQISTQHKISAASEDPTAAEQIMGTDGALTAVAQYQRNIDAATSRNSAEDSALGHVTDLLARAKELMTQEATGTSTAATKSIASKEMEQIFNSVISIGNTQFAGSYLFGGDTSTTAPFSSTGTGSTLDFTHTAATGTRAVEVSAGHSLTATHDGKQLLLDTGVLTALRDATTALATNSATGTSGSLQTLDNSFQQIQELVGETGARTNSLDIASQNLTSLKTNLTAFLSNVQDIDVEETVTTMVTKQTAYQAALMATSKVIGVSLADYLH
jgi:flagellar hook-associated protein 3 FlgL